MIKMKSDKIYRQIKKEVGSYRILPELLFQFCKEHGYTCIIIKYNEDGLYLIDNVGNMCQLDFLCEPVAGAGVFSDLVNNEDNSALYDMLNVFLNKIESGDVDIAYVNDPSISIRTRA